MTKIIINRNWPSISICMQGPWCPLGSSAVQSQQHERCFHSHLDHVALVKSQPFCASSVSYLLREGSDSTYIRGCPGHTGNPEKHPWGLHKGTKKQRQNPQLLRVCILTPRSQRCTSDHSWHTVGAQLTVAAQTQLGRQIPHTQEQNRQRPE